jgi:hypothetical protein
VSAMPEVYDDEELLAALRQALTERQAVPPEFVEAAKNAFAWHNIDAELAELTYDSSRDAEPAPSTRAETASIRALTFTSPHLTIELEVTHDSLLGQIVPAQPGTIKVQLRDGAESTVPADEIGRFTIRPMPAGTFRLHCRTAADADALTGWITL